MDIIIKEKKNEKNLFQVRYYDANFCEIKTLKGVYFESEEIANKYGKERFIDEDGDSYYKGAVMENGVELPESNIYIGDANHPGEIYVCPTDLKDKLLEYMSEEGLAPYTHKSRWVPKNYSICYVSPAKETGGYCHVEFEWHDEPLE